MSASARSGRCGKRSAALDIPAFIHPEGLRDPWYHKFALWNSIGQQIEEAKAMASIIYEGLLDAIPGLKIVIAHGGGYFPYCVGRVDRNVEKPEAQVNIGDSKPSDYLRHFYYDTCVFDRAGAGGAVPARRRRPHPARAPTIRSGEDDPVGVVKSAVTLSNADLAKVAGGTAARLLGIDVAQKSQAARSA